jgi:anthranilate synthase component 1
MNIQPDKEAFLRLCEQGNVVPVFTDLMADFETPVSAYAKLKDSGPAYILESIEGGDTVSRYSFIGCRPRKIFACFSEFTEIREPGQPTRRIPTPHDPLKLIEAEISGYRPVQVPGMPRFMGGAVGYLGYEYIHRVEPTVPEAARDELGIPLVYFMLSDTLLMFDRAKQTLRLCVNAHVPPSTGSAQVAHATYDAAVTALHSLYGLLKRPGKLASAPLVEPPQIEIPPSNFTREAFEKMVEDSKEYIRAGDIIQVVLAQRFVRDFAKTPLDLYRALRTVNPSPYMFLLDTGDFALVGASPEVHVRVTDGRVEIRPIAGTRRRGTNASEDLALEKELLADEKERAEHLMLVDLARNDIGRVCSFGSVIVPEFMTVERYSHVMHIVSQVEGRIAPDKNAFDLMRATFPAGTVSGAPKIRAMQIIAEQEKLQRGSYAGALGYFSYDGNLDSCITLRTALVKDGKVYIQAGGGIVADSVPALEYQESVNKASALLKAVAIAQEL